MTSEPNLQRLAVLGLMELPQLIKRGALSPIPDMVAEVEAVKTDNDIVKRWLLETATDASDIAGRWAADVYSDFKKWCESAGERFGVSQMVFTKRVLAALAVLDVKETRDRARGRRGKRFVAATQRVERLG
jgi:phage/plasmid-associated DNA primase